MKLIIAIIRPDKLEAVQDALSEKEVHLMTVSNVQGCGSQRGYTETFRGMKIPIRLMPKIKLEIGVNENFVEPTVNAILKAARSEPGKIGDGKIFVLPMDQCFRIRTGESGNKAIGP
ncbi:MAG TPA: P-II family nitrogen regulator [Tepidisphaeraceae bacterium]|jgi:nitrogen regulatory protein P-II 1